MDTNDYKISFFKPTTEHARINRNLTIILVIIWAVAVFGFQSVLKIIETPTPEPLLKEFNTVWEQVDGLSGGEEELKTLGTVVLKALSKPFIKPADKAKLKDVFGGIVFKLTPEANKIALAGKVGKFQKLEETITSLSDKEYTGVKTELVNDVSSTLSIDEQEITKNYAPFMFDKQPKEMDEASMAALPGIMNLYLTHNRSFLTDAKFLGFPFHYFYTAVLLLIIFVFLCWLYCKRTDSTHLKHEVVEQHD